MMTDATWDDYTGDGGSSLDPLAGTSADTIQDEVLAGQAADYISTAGSDSDWSDWNASTGDEATASAQSYFDSATEDAAAGYGDLANEEITDGNAQLDVASNSYASAGDYDSEASSYLGGAGDDLSTLSADTGDDGTAALAADVGDASDDYSAAASDYADASSDASSYSDDSAADS
jgi:hypothetical protein